MSSTQTTPDAAPVVRNYARLVSPQLIGSLLNFFFYGTLLIQVYIYRLCFPKDARSVKFVVYFIFFAMTVCTCLNAADVEYWFGSGFGDIDRFTNVRNARTYSLLVGPFIATLVQLFFACRIVVTRHSISLLAVLVGITALVQGAGGMGVGIVSYINTTRDMRRIIFIYLWLIAGAAADILIAIAMTCFLFTRPNASAPRDFLTSAVRLVVETNIFSTLVALVGLILFVCVPHRSFWVCPTMILPGVYANTLLVALNNRAFGRLESDSEAAPHAAPSTTLAFTSELATSENLFDSKRPTTRAETYHSGSTEMSFAPRDVVGLGSQSCASHMATEGECKA
ncbi:hypothetical protein DFH06DRAFT_1298572 [Mycena polygramma]|nr:hypothetical protein DFH06DRAFT_1298572 [Mycena polygramma]